MNIPEKITRDDNSSEVSHHVSYQCPSCNMLLWHSRVNEKVLCPFCSNVLPDYVTKLSPERMIMQNEESEPKNGTLKDDSTSPFVLEFFMVRVAGYICMAYYNGDGKWRGAFDNQELTGQVHIVE